jgi:hypothetical protein
MSTDISLQTTTYQVGNKQWLLQEPDVKLNVTLDISKFSQNEAQKITVDATGGTFTLTYAGQTTSALAYNISAANLQTAIAGLSTVGAGNVSVSGSDGGPFTVTFIGTLGSQDVPLLTANSASLTGNTHTATIVTVTPAHYANGYIPSGTAIGKVTATSLFGPYDDAASDGRQTLYGFTYADVRVVHQNGTVATKVGTGAVVNDTIISTGKLPFQSGSGSLDANGKADVPTIRYEA